MYNKGKSKVIMGFMASSYLSIINFQMIGSSQEQPPFSMLVYFYQGKMVDQEY